MRQEKTPYLYYTRTNFAWAGREGVVDPRTLTDAHIADFGPAPGHAAIPHRTDRFIEVPFCTGSDFSGNLVEVANYETLVERWAGWQGRDGGTVLVRGYTGYNNCFALYVNVDNTTPEQQAELDEVLATLDRYPVIDDEALARLEAEAVTEAIDTSYLREFERVICATHPDLNAYPELPEAPLRTLLLQCLHAADVTWSNEVGREVIPSLDADQLIETVDPTDFIEFWSIYPEGHDHHLPRTPFHPNQLWLPNFVALLVYIADFPVLCLQRLNLQVETVDA